MKISKNLKVSQTVANYNGVIKIIGENWYPEIKDEKKGVNIFDSMGLFVNGQFVCEIESKKPTFRHWSLMTGKEIHQINTYGVINKTGLTKSFATCLIADNTIVESNKNLNNL